MLRFILIVTLFAFQAHALSLSGKSPVSTVVPVNDFSVILTFSETVQKSGNAVTVTVGDTANNDVAITNDDANKFSMSCSTPTAKWFNKVVLVPISRSGGLKGGATMTATVPSTCFKAYRASSTTDVFMGNAHETFTFTTESTTTCSVTAGTPFSIQSTTAGTNIPYSPANGAWLSSPSNTEFDLYFSESLDFDAGLISVTETTGSSVASVIDSFAPTTSKATLDDGGFKGRVTLKKGASWFKPGAKYSLSIAKNAFKDKLGNALLAQFASADDYHVKVTTTLNNAKYPDSATQNFTVNHKMVLDFAHHVKPGTGSMKLCSGWSTTSACTAGPTVGTSNMMFLGKRVIVNPSYTQGTTYNVSIQDNAFLYYAGMSADGDKKWTYSFSVDASTAVDTGAPELIDGFVDCNGDGALVDSNLKEQSCSGDKSSTHDFLEISSDLDAAGNTPMLTSAKFKLYFKETVALKTGAKAQLTADDGTSSENIASGANFAVGTGTENCVTTVSPTLKTGKKYTLMVGSGEITDDSTLKNAYGGTSFTFYTPLETASTPYAPINTATNVPKESLIKVSFKDQPRLGPTPPTEYTTPYLTVNGETVKLTDTNAVKFQGNDILVIPQTPMAAGNTYTVKIPAHQLRYMTTDLAFSFTTRTEDTTKPRVRGYGPTATSMFRKTLDGTAGASTPPATAYPKVPYVLFTEGVDTVAGSTAAITIAESGGGNTYSIAASDSTCSGAGGCVVIDTTYNSKVWLYPLGKTTTTNQANEWATAGRTYTVTLPDGSFTDTITTGVNMNALDEFSWTFGVSADLVGPTLSSVEAHAPKVNGASLASGGTISTAHSSFFLTFNEQVAQGDDMMAIRSFDYSAQTPAFSATGTYNNDKYAAVSLGFDQKVQAGSGTVGLYKANGDTVLGTAVAVASAEYAGSKVFFQPSTSLADANSYYVKTSAAGAIKGAGGANAAAIDTRSAGSVQYVNAQTTPSLTVLYNSLSDYACMPNGNKLPDATLYFSTRVAMDTGASFLRTGGGCGVFDDYPGVSCDSDTSADCSTVQAANSNRVAVGIGAQATSKKYKATVFMSAASACTGTGFEFANYSFATTSGATLADRYSMTHATSCTTVFDVPGSKLVRVYLASGTFSQKMVGGVPTMGKQFEVVIPANAVKDSLGNYNSAESVAYTHDTSAPTVDSSSCSPGSGSDVDEYEAVYIAFNEVVQAGSGKFYIYDQSNPGEETFTIDVTASSSEPGALFVDKYVALTPKTHCMDSRRRTGVLNMTNATYVFSCGGANEPNCTYHENETQVYSRRLSEEEDTYDESWEGTEAAERRLQTTTCRTLGDLEAGKTYYMTAAAGVVKDVFGTSSPAVNTKSYWSVKVSGASSSDSRSPKVVYAETPTATFSNTWGVGPTLEGSVYFSEKVQKISPDSTITITDCGADMTCGGTKAADDFAVTLTGADLSYGDGSTTDGTKEYGLLKYTKQVPTANSKFKFSIPASAVEDFSGKSSNNKGPTSEYSFYFPVGDVAFPAGSDSQGPTVVKVTPTATTRQAPSRTLTLYFNEDVQKGSGAVSFCTNSDAGTAACATGAYSNGDSAVYYIDNTTASTLDRRVVTMSLPNLKYGQTLYAMMPTGFVRDNSQSSNPMATGLLAQGNAAYSFTVIDEETVAPHLQMIVPSITSGSATTIKSTDKIKLYFSEAVQAGTGVNISNDFDAYPQTISGNQVHIGGAWTPGSKYVLTMDVASFKDLNGRYMSPTTSASPPMLDLSDQQFTIFSDTAAPTGSFTDSAPLQKTTAASTTAFELNFNELVQKGTGKISIYSSGAATSATTTNVLQEEFDVATLPLVSTVGTGSIMMSKTTVQATTAMKIGHVYRLIVPSTAYTDTMGNAYAGMAATTNTNYKKLKEGADCEAPVFLTASMGETANTGSNAAFSASGGKVVMYFSENVQSQTSGSVKLQPSNGGSFCSATGQGCASVGAACSTACGGANNYKTTSASDVTLSSLTISGSKVTAAVPALQSGYGYKLTVDRRAFTDAAGNSLTATLPGDATAGQVYTMQVAIAAAAATDSTGPLHLTTGTPPTVTSTFPTTGAKMMPPSTAITISFDETVQAGTGSVTFNGNTKVAVSNCMFDDASMRCKPSGNLAGGTAYDVVFTADAVQDSTGNTMRAATVGATNSKLTFTTVDLDYTPPTLAAVSGVTYASTTTGTVAANTVDYAKPFDPVNMATNVAKGTLVSMTFSEVVQYGAGNVLFNGVAASTSTLFYSGSTVYFQRNDLSAGTSYAVTTSQDGVFKDLNNQPLAQITSGFTFATVPDDTVKPTMMQMLPKNDISSADDAPSTMITLYFSEAVQAVTGGEITVGPNGGTQNAIPVDNSDPNKGSVTVVGAAVSIDPFDDVGYDKTVDVKISANAFKDLFGANAFDATDYQFRTSAFAFSASKTNNATIGFSQREGSILVAMSGYMLLYGGVDSTGCMGDSWTSTTGANWVAVSQSAVTPGKQAHSKYAMDENGCMVLLGNSGAGCSEESNKIYKTCGVNTTTNQLEWTAVTDAPAVKGKASWTISESGISGHNIAIVGGWKLVIVDSVGGKVWNMLDKEMAVAQEVASSVPFAKRTDPILFADSGNVLYLLGGYDGDACGKSDSTCSAVFTDVWHSADFGATWACLTANYDKTMTSTYTKGIGRHVSAIMTHDDFMFLIAGNKANATTGSSDIWASSGSPRETNKPIDYTSSMVPFNTATGVLSGSTVTLYFDEVVSYKSGTAPHFVDTGNNSFVLPTATSISRQVMTMSLSGSQKFTAGNTIQVKVPAGSLQDAAGNTLAGDLTYSFTVNTDNAKPTFDSFTTTSNYSAGWDKRATTTSTLILTTSQPVYAVGGVVNVTSTSNMAGAKSVSFDLSDATTDVYNYNDANGDSKGMIFFTMPVGTNLTENTEYRVSIPAGMVKDAAGNLNGAWDRFTFKTISGANSYNDYANPIPSVTAIPVMAGTVNDTAKPTFVSMWPPVGAGDVLAADDTSVYLFFNEPVKFNSTHPGVIQIVNNTNKVCGSINLTYEYFVSQAPVVGHSTEFNATKIKIGGFLKKDQNFTISVPAGVIVDLKNNPVDAFTKTFKTLAETADTLAPVVVRAQPYDGQGSILSTSHTFGVWFSERVFANTGSITIKTGATSVPMDINDANVTIAGAKMTFSYYAGALSTTGSWNLILPPGLLKDEAGNQYRGLNDTAGAPSQDFTVVAADATKPTLSAKLPAHEATPTYTRATTTAFQFTFSEAIQAGSGSIVCTPKYTSPTISITSTSAEVAIAGSVVTVSPTTDMMPGEVYGVTIGAGAFTDLQGNAYAGLASGYTMSTKAGIAFSQVSTGNFDEGAANYFNGERYAAAAAVDASNNIYVLGGHNGTARSAAMLNDVWKLATNRPINCAASVQPTYDCTTDGEMPGTTNAVTACDGVYAGKSNFQKKIWKAPSEAGQQCQFASGGAFASELGQIVEAGHTKCPCPMCTTAPANVSADNPKFNAITDLEFSADLPIMANGATLTLTCETGYEAKGSFVCGFDTLESGKFVQPYPECQLQPCSAPPSVGSSMSLIANQCNSSETRFDDGRTCNYVCDEGYGVKMNDVGVARTGNYDGQFTCQQGTWVIDHPGSCVTITPTTAAPTTAAATTTAVETVTYIEHSVEIVQDFGNNTAEDLLADPAFVGAVKKSLVAGVVAATPELSGISEDSIIINSFTLTPVRRLANGGRRLAAKSLKVDYSIIVPPGVATSADDLAASIVANKAAFESTMSTSYAAAYEAATGSPPAGFTGVTASTEAGTRVVTVAPAAPPATTPPPATTKAPEPATTEAPPATTQAPAPAPTPATTSASEEEEESDSGAMVGGIVGAIVGVAVLGGCYYMYKKKNAQE